jgi:endonuclease/exonuclease/phosphatase family metal-dependent hydrolase
MIGRMRIRLACLLPMVAALGCGSGGGSTPANATPVALTTVKVMTRNLYLGADLLPVVTAMTVDQLPGQVAALWKSMKASDLPGRAKLLADEISAAKPDVVGLQEAIVFYKQTPSDFTAHPMPNATEVEFDYVQTLLAELAARGTTYVAAVVADHTDVELPADDDAHPGEKFDVRMTDRDAILVRADRMATNPQKMLFPTHLLFNVPFNTNGPMVNLVRGLTWVSVVVDGAPFTFANTHLEVGGGTNAQAQTVLTPLQENQANDLIKMLASVTGPLVLVGDFNSAANGSTTHSYATIAQSFTDAFAKVSPGVPGFTCCTDIAAPASMAGERIDIVFYRGGVGAQDVQLVGTDAAKKTAGGLWPSDHFGVVATLGVPGGSGSSGGGTGGGGGGGGGGKKY